MNASVIKAIFKRNFVSYFSSPTGYVFICVFVALTSAAAFCWPDFFNNNLATLDQLNQWFPYILLVFVPAITMGIWAEERKLGTDELLLTIPASDLDVVLGKYLAGLAIFTVSLVFSLVCNLLVLSQLLGAPDVGLFMGNYFGYWIVGTAMLSIGMVASFLTSNLTVAFILGTVCNLPLVFVPSLFPESLPLVRRWGIAEQFEDFARGMLTLASLSYFLSIVAVMIYLCTVLIGRRHWRSGAEAGALPWHYALRLLCLLVTVVGLNMYFSRHNRLRVDTTVERLSSLAPRTRQLLANLDTKHPVRIEGFLSQQVPESYVQARLNLQTVLREFAALGGSKVDVRIVDNLEPLSEQAALIEQQYGIRPQRIDYRRTDGSLAQDEVFLAVVLSCGLEKLQIPFIDKGISVEYELARSISTVIQEKRKRVGVLATDVKLFGGFDMSSMSSTPSALLVEELKKAFELVPVDASAPITERYDVLLAVQPSSLSPEQMDHFVAAVQSGQPTAIFEDPMPFPNWFPGVPGTNDPKQPGGGAMGMFGGQRPTPKGDIRKLWQTLGVDFSGGSVVWQDYNPYPRFTDILSREWVFLNRNMKDAQPFADGEPITKELQQLLFVFPGEITRLNSSPLKFTGLVRTGNATGTVVLSKASDPFSFGGPRINLQRIELAEVSTGELYTLAARIRGKLKTENAMMSDEPAGGAPAAADSPPAATVPAPAAAAAAEGGAGSAAAKPAGDHDHDHGPGHDHDHPHGNLPAVGAAAGKEAEINVILISDIDCLYGAFFHIRAQGDGDEDGSAMSFDNVTFVLNVLDDLAGEQGMIEIRSRRPAYRTLTKVNEATESAREEAEKNRTEYIKKFEESTRKAQEQLDAEVEKLRNRTDLSNEEKSEQLAILLRDVSLRKAAADEKAQRDRDRELRRIEQRLNTKVRSVQDTFKIWALLLPPIPPLLIGAAVFFSRRAREQEGVDQARLR